MIGNFQRFFNTKYGIINTSQQNYDRKTIFLLWKKNNSVMLVGGY